LRQFWGWCRFLRLRRLLLLGLADGRTSTSAARRLGQATKDAINNKTVPRMSAYATQCPRFRKINLAPVSKWRGGGVAPNEVAQSVMRIAFQGRFSNLSGGNV
jgi:hypothetical protein